MLLSSQGRRISGDNASILGDLCRYDKNAQLSSNERPLAKGVSQEWREDKESSGPVAPPKVSEPSRFALLKEAKRDTSLTPPDAGQPAASQGR